MKKIAYCFGAIAASLSSQAFAAYIVFFYVDVIKLPAYLAAIAILIFGVWNAINDPLIGYVSDHTHSCWGRRIPYIIFGAIPLGLTFFFLWSPPFTGIFETTALWLYFVVMTCLFDLFYTLTFLNWSALYPEMFTTLKERTQVNVIRQIFMFIGMFLGIALPPMLFNNFGWGAVGLVFSLIIIIAMLISLLGSREHLEYSHEKQLNLLTSFKATFVNPAFIIFAFSNLLVQYALMMLVASIPFFTKYVLGVPAEQITAMMAIAFLFAIPAFVLWRMVAVRVGAKATYMLALAVTEIALVPLFFIQNAVLVLPTAVLAVAGASGMLLLVDVMLSDIIDLDELSTRTRREGMYFGMHSFILRFSIALQVTTFGAMLAFSGYNPYVFTQTREFLAGMRWLIAGFPLIALTLSFMIISFYPLSGRARFKAMKENLKNLHQQKGVN